jgi:cyclophilin family peptidyl-prolyl cis-trans isomerase/protein-disulfide isomerase
MLVVLAIALALSGCQPQTAPAMASTVTASVGKVGPSIGGATVVMSVRTAAPSAAAPTAAPTTAPPTPAQAAAATVAATAAPTPAEPCVADERGLLPTGPAPVPAVRSTDWTLGPADALVTVVEYADVQCPPCAGTAPILRQLQNKYPQDVRLVFRHFPLDSLHPLARIAGQAAEAAGAQDKFWEMLELLYARQSEWSSKPEAEFKTWVAEQAVTLGLDRARFETDLVGEKAVAALKDGLQEATDLKLGGTPSLAVNGFHYGGNRDLWTLSAIVDLLKLEQRDYASCPPTVIDADKSYQATLSTSKGDIVIELLPQKAPLAVNSFVFLAREGWFNGVPFHRVISGFVAQTGDPSGTGYGGPGYTFRDEISPEDKFDAAGLVAMANAGANNNGSQFFITFGPQEALNGKHTIFGRVISGMEVATQLTVRDPTQDPSKLPEPDRITGVTISEK